MARTRKALRRWVAILGVLALLATPVAIILAIKTENDRRWAEFVTRWEAEGERFDLPPHLPAPVGDAVNLARHPDIRAYVSASNPEGDWSESLPKGLPGWNLEAYLEYTSRLGDRKPTTIFPSFGLPSDATPEHFRTHLGNGYHAWSKDLDALAQALQERERLWHDVNWARIFIDAEMPDFSAYHKLGKTVLARAAIRRGLRDSDGLLEDLVATMNLSRACGDVPLLLCGIYQAGLGSSLMDEIRPALADRLLEENQLKVLEGQFARMPSLSQTFRKSLRMERALILSYFDAIESARDSEALNSLPARGNDWVRGKLDQAWMSANRLVLCQQQQDLFLGRGGQLADLRAWQQAARDRIHHKRGRFVASLGHFTLDTFGSGAELGEAFFQTEADWHRVRIAVALERFRLARGSYPPALATLAPGFLPTLAAPDPDCAIEYELLSEQSWRLSLCITGNPGDDWTKN